MPRLMDSTPDPDEMQQGKIGNSSFSFSGKRIEHLTSTEYTLATIAVDETGSVTAFADLLWACLGASVDGCKLSPRSDNIMLRVLLFGTQYPNGVHEIHGFKPVNEIDPGTYQRIVPRGLTTLNDACFSAIGATNAYGEDLRKMDFNTNGIMVVITDGAENASSASMSMVKSELAATVREEKLESMISILVGINAAQQKQTLEDYQRETGIDKYIDAGDVSADTMAKLAGFISRSVSSQSQHLGTGGPSQQIPAQI